MANRPQVLAAVLVGQTPLTRRFGRLRSLIRPKVLSASLRAPERPICRWSPGDAVRAGAARNPAMRATVEKRIWSTPPWLTPAT